VAKTIESILIGYLNSKGYTAYGEEPEKPPREYLVVGKVGSRHTNHIDGAVITIRSYSESLEQAAVLNKQVKYTMLYELPELSDIAGVTLNSDYPQADPDTRRYRYQAVYDITYYEDYEE
jgi:hypothetical protein